MDPKQAASLPLITTNPQQATRLTDPIPTKVKMSRSKAKQNPEHGNKIMNANAPSFTCVLPIITILAIDFFKVGET